MKRCVKCGDAPFEYILIRSVRKDVLFKALPKGETRVFAPQWMRLKDIDEMVRARADELRNMHQALDRQISESKQRHPVGEGDHISVEGRMLRIHLKKSAQIRLVADEESFILSLPEPEDDEKVRAAIRHALSKRMLERVRQRLEYYAPRIGVSYGRVAVRDQKSRWGSCSSKHNLNFNWKLIMAPKEVLDYVVIHELCHLLEFNHSRRFWSLVEAQMPEYEVWKKWLKQHGCELGV